MDTAWKSFWKQCVSMEFSIEVREEVDIQVPMEVPWKHHGCSHGRTEVIVLVVTLRFHRTSTRLQWCSHGPSMATQRFRRDFHGVSMIVPRCVP